VPPATAARLPVRGRLVGGYSDPAANIDAIEHCFLLVCRIIR
jgi:hypothetical protein